MTRKIETIEKLLRETPVKLYNRKIASEEFNRELALLEIVGIIYNKTITHFTVRKFNNK